MIAKLFEIRDEGTLIVALAVKLSPSCQVEQRCLARAGYARGGNDVWLTKISGGYGKGTSDPFRHGLGRTMRFAHKTIEKQFDRLDTGAVVDVHYMLGETPEPCKSDLLPDDLIEGADVSFPGMY